MIERKSENIRSLFTSICKNEHCYCVFECGLISIYTSACWATNLDSNSVPWLFENRIFSKYSLVVLNLSIQTSPLKHFPYLIVSFRFFFFDESFYQFLVIYIIINMGCLHGCDHWLISPSLPFASPSLPSLFFEVILLPSFSWFCRHIQNPRKALHIRGWREKGKENRRERPSSGSTKSTRKEDRELFPLEIACPSHPKENAYNFSRPTQP